jgi:hypothetical protein
VECARKGLLFHRFLGFPLKDGDDLRGALIDGGGVGTLVRLTLDPPCLSAVAIDHPSPHAR